MLKKPRKPDKNEYDLVIKGISGESRHAFKAICRVNHRETPAQIFARIVREELNKTFGEGHADYKIQAYRDYQNRLKAQEEDKPEL
ncbi:hypothetical protein SAMN05216428_1045 [Nitrosospira sp. Nsp11]|uniref:hypothetical protein n=1 Tax=Nitrosospira sp. Nsp11 TaxID=1855338 RepID=UPI00091754C8|nr:hypothetical protein [Nitrosospira sp. Nsp11]SHL59134.1 hypothetical protein SAMN05216428_1045 [Nitrosospira sp. Nsp11]